MFSPITKTTASQSVADQLFELIRQRILKPGDKLPGERDLMEKLGVGRSSIREALQILSALNVIAIVPGLGTFVKEPQPSDILRTELMGLLIGNTMARELLEAREMIEPAAVRLACVRGTQQDFDAIHTLLIGHRAALHAGEPINEYGAQFHILLARTSHNRVVVSFMESILGLLMERGRKIENIPNYAYQELEEHGAIFKLVRERDADGATELLLQHIIRAAATFDTQRSEEG